MWPVPLHSPVVGSPSNEDPATNVRTSPLGDRVTALDPNAGRSLRCAPHASVQMESDRVERRRTVEISKARLKQRLVGRIEHLQPRHEDDRRVTTSG